MTAAEKKMFDSLETMLRGYQDVIVPRLYEEIEELKKENARLRLEMSYMKNPNAIGDSHEMGSW